MEHWDFLPVSKEDMVSPKTLLNSVSLSMLSLIFLFNIGEDTKPTTRYNNEIMQRM